MTNDRLYFIHMKIFKRKANSKKAKQRKRNSRLYSLPLVQKQSHSIIDSSRHSRFIYFYLFVRIINFFWFKKSQKVRHEIDKNEHEWNFYCAFSGFEFEYKYESQDEETEKLKEMKRNMQKERRWWWSIYQLTTFIISYSLHSVSVQWMHGYGIAHSSINTHTKFDKLNELTMYLINPYSSHLHSESTLHCCSYFNSIIVVAPFIRQVSKYSTYSKIKICAHAPRLQSHTLLFHFQVHKYKKTK